MTIKELYKWAQAVGAENAKIELQYQDDGGVYEGSCPMTEIDVEVDDNVKPISVTLA